MKRNIHTTPPEILAQNSDLTVSAINANTQKLNKVIDAIVDNQNTTGFLATIKAVNKLEECLENCIELLARKQEEVKSATLATNITLKKVEKAVSREPQKFPKFPDFPKFPEIPKIDLSKTEKLLTELLIELRKPEEPIEIKIELV